MPTVAAIEKLGSKAIAVKVDVADDASTKAMAAAAVKRFGRIDGAKARAISREQRPDDLVGTALYLVSDLASPRARRCWCACACRRRLQDRSAT